MLEYTVTEEMAGRRIYSVMRREMMMSATLIKRIKWTGGISANGVPVHTRYEVSSGDVITVDTSLGEVSDGLVPQCGDIDIIFENDDLLAVNKPVGVLTHPSRARLTDTLANYAAGYLNGPCHVVNRLDRDTSGVVLFAKSSRAKTIAIKSLRESGDKEYVAVCLGVPASAEGKFNMPIKRLSPTSLMRAVSPDGESALTLYRLEKTAELEGVPCSLVSFKLITGRTHQIRVHAFSAGIPILGDPQYNTEDSASLSEKLGLTCQLLHAKRLSFTWAADNSAVVIDAPVKRNDFRKIMQKF